MRNLNYCIILQTKNLFIIKFYLYIYKFIFESLIFFCFLSGKYEFFTLLLLLLVIIFNVFN